jgi:cytochrome c-type biogenesis protein
LLGGFLRGDVLFLSIQGDALGAMPHFLGDADESPRLGARLRRAALVGGLASLGFFVVYAALAGVVAAVGTELLGNIALLELVVGVLLVGLGVPMAAGRLSPASLHVRLPKRRRSKSGYLLFGVVYAVAAAGCTAPIFVGIAGVALGAGPLGAALTFAAYATGMATLMVTVTVLVAVGRETVLDRVSPNVGRVTRAAGVLLVVAGIAQVYLFLFRFGGIEMLGL